MGERYYLRKLLQRYAGLARQRAISPIKITARPKRLPIAKCLRSDINRNCFINGTATAAPRFRLYIVITRYNKTHRTG